MNSDVRNNKPSFKLSDIRKMDLPFGGGEEYELGHEQMKQLSPDVRDTLIRSKIRKTIREVGDGGLTVAEIVNCTGFDNNVVTKHLKALEGLREVYSHRKGKRLVLYFPNGRPLHQLGKKRFDWGNPILEIYLAKGPNDRNFFYILEKKYTIIEGEVSEGAVMIPMDRIDEFIQALSDLEGKFKEAKL